MASDNEIKISRITVLVSTSFKYSDQDAQLPHCCDNSESVFK